MRRCAALTGLIAFLVFLPSLSHGWLNYDDPMFLLGETGWRGLGLDAWRWAFASRVGSVYQPLAWLSYGLDYTLWGMQPLGFHLQSVLWHALSAGLMFLIARRLLDDDASALFAALVFAVHPLRVESVSWISERRDVLGCAFTLAAVWAYISGRHKALVFVFFLLSLLSKGMALLLPVALLGLDYYPLKRLDRRAVIDKLPLFGLSFVFGIIGLYSQERIRWTWEQHGVLARSAQSVYALVFYVWKTLWPSGLLPLYELRPPLHPFEPRFLYSAAAVAAAAGVCWRLRKSRPYIAVSAFWYAVLLFPVSGLFQFGPQLVADRYSYITTLPFAVLAGAVAHKALVNRRAQSVAVLLSVVVTLSFLSVRQQQFWHDSETLWSRVLAGDPPSAMAHAQLALLRVSAGRFDEARAHYQAALAAYPGCVEAQDRLAALRERGEAPPAELTANVETHPLCRRVRGDLGALRAQTGDLAGAVESLRVSVLIDPNDLAARRNLARARAELSRR